MTDYLTMVFRQPINAAARALLESGEWTAASHSHAIQDRDEALREVEKLRTEIERLRAELEALRGQEPVAWAEMLADAREVFDANGSETPQVVRDVIEYVASWREVYADKSRAACAESRG